jgi:tetratricopeptide (TPR) repeat protein
VARFRAQATTEPLSKNACARQPDVYRQDVAASLNNLGNLYRRTGRLVEAEKAYSEALSIIRLLTAPDPGAYRPKVATTLSNLALLYVNTGRLTNAEKAWVEALAIRRELAAHDPGAYRADVATTLNNLGFQHRRVRRGGEGALQKRLRSGANWLPMTPAPTRQFWHPPLGWSATASRPLQQAMWNVESLEVRWGRPHLRRCANRHDLRSWPHT